MNLIVPDVHIIQEGVQSAKLILLGDLRYTIQWSSPSCGTSSARMSDVREVMYAENYLAKLEKSMNFIDFSASG